jgi:predicted ATPase
MGQKVMAGFVIMIGLTAVIGFLGIRNLRTIADRDGELYKNNMIPVQQLGQTALALNKMRVNVLYLAVNHQDAAKFNTSNEQMNEYAKTFEDSLASLNGVTSEKEIELRDRIKENYEKYKAFREEYTVLAKNHKITEAYELIAKTGAGLATAINKDIDALIKLNTDEAAMAAKDNGEFHSNKSK